MVNETTAEMQLRESLELTLVAGTKPLRINAAEENTCIRQDGKDAYLNIPVVHDFTRGHVMRDGAKYLPFTLLTKSEQEIYITQDMADTLLSDFGFREKPNGEHYFRNDDPFSDRAKTAFPFLNKTVGQPSKAYAMM